MMSVFIAVFSSPLKVSSQCQVFDARKKRFTVCDAGFAAKHDVTRSASDMFPKMSKSLQRPLMRINCDAVSVATLL